MSSVRLSKLTQLKEREDLKGSLVAKYAAKYGKSSATVAREVDKFLLAYPLTEENLKKLDDKVRLAESEHMSSISGMSVQSGASALPRITTKLTSARSVSYMSGASKLSSSDKPGDDILSVSGASVVSSVIEVPQGKDEWAAILKYKSIVFQEEEHQRKLRLADQKQAFRRELDRQMNEKEARRMAERQELMEFLNNEAHNKQLHDDREAQEAEQRRQKALKEKKTRSQQIQDRNRKLKKEQRDTKLQDKEYVRQMQIVHQKEKEAMHSKKLQEATRMTKMLAENAEWQLRRQQDEQQQKREEIELQHQYAAMLEKHENDRLALLKEREQKQKELMEKMKTTVLKEQATTSKAEDRALVDYYQTKQQLELVDDEAGVALEIRRRRDIRSQLEQQIKDKQDRQRQERNQETQQARLWRHDSEAFLKGEEEEKARKRILYLQHARELREQMELKASQGGGMTTIERAYNKEVLKEVVKSNS
jgi:hypothetical protein